MPALQPYPALFFFGADDTDEVTTEYADAYDDGGYLKPGQLVDIVQVVACESVKAMDRVWFIRKGKLEHAFSWQIRRHD